MGKKLLVILVLVTNFSLARAQSPAEVLKLINTVKGGNHDFYTEIPFEYRNGCIIIKVDISGRTYDYIFDSGGYNDITDEIQALNQFPVLSSQVVGSSNKLKARVNLVKVDSLKIGSLVFREVAALQMDFKNSPTISCTVDGALIGASIIKQYCWQIDYERKKIIVTDKVERLPLTGSVKIPVTFNSRLMPFIQAKLNGRNEKFMLDLGSSSLCILTDKAGKEHAAGRKVITIEGASSEGGNGVLRQTMHLFGADSLEMGSIRLHKVPVLYLPAAVDNLIGNSIIENYLVTLDFPDSALYLSPVKAPPRKEGLSTYGFTLKYQDGKVVVASVYKGLPGDRAGLRTGDVVTAANGQVLNYPDLCSSVAPLAALTRSGDVIELEISANDKIRTVRIEKIKVF